MRIYNVSNDYDIIDNVDPDRVIYRDLFNTYVATNNKLFIINEKGQVAEISLDSVKEVIKKQERNNVLS